MKKLQTFAFCSLALLASCTKPSNTTNNYITNDTTRIVTQVPTASPAFIIDGITDIVIDRSNTVNFIMPLVVQYEDSAQQTVTVSVSGIPGTAGGSTKNGLLITGIPTFNCSINIIYEPGAYPIPVGTYPITLTCAGSVSGVKTYTFNLIIQ